MDNISVIIRNRNEERYIGYAIQSVFDTFKKPEIIVVDNHLILKILKHIPLIHIHLVNP